MKNLRLISIILSALLFTVGCSAAESKDTPPDHSPEVSSPAAESAEEASKVREDKIAEQKMKIETLESLNSEYAEYLQSVIEILDENQKQEIAESNYQYSLKVNEEPVPKDGVVKVSRGSFTVSIQEELSTNIPLPENMPVGSLSGEHYSEHMVFIGEDDFQTESYDGTIRTAVTYTFEEGYAFDSLEIQITEELKDRLGLETNLIRIIVE